MADRLRVGVIGCGLIAQVMHLNYLRELSDRFEVAAVCDLSAEVRAACAREYGVTEQYEYWQELVTRPLDAVLVRSLSRPPRRAFTSWSRSRCVFPSRRARRWSPPPTGRARC